MKNADKFKEYIRALVREEVKNVISEAFVGRGAKSSAAPAATRANENATRRLPPARTPQAQPQKPTNKWNTKNPILNQILAETQASGATVSELGIIDYGLPAKNEIFSDAARRHDVKIETPVRQVVAADPQTQLQEQLGIYADYSEKMKLIEQKSKNSRFGGAASSGLFIPPGVPTDFSTID
jgi:hypothetical protein